MRHRNPSQPGETPAEDIANALQVLSRFKPDSPNADDRRWQAKQPVTLTAVEYDSVMARLESALRKLRSQGHGPAYRTNPFLYVYNPPIRGRGLAVGDRKGVTLNVRLMGLIAAELHDIRYRHAEDGKPYEHTFETKTRAWAAVDETGRHVVVLRGENGNKVWEDR